MPIYHVNKAPFGFLDTKFGPPTANFMAAYNDALTGSPSGPPLDAPDAAMTLQQRAAQLAGPGGNLTLGQVTHFANDWLSSWWPNLSVADTLRSGIHEAIDCAKTAQLPMEFFWVCLQDNVFQIYYSKGLQQVTVLILTPPPPPGYNPGPLVTPESLWVVKRWDQFDDDYPTINGTTAPVLPPQSLGFTTSPPPGMIIKQQIWHS